MIFYCGKVVLFALLVALTLTAAHLLDGPDERKSAEIILARDFNTVASITIEQTTTSTSNATTTPSSSAVVSQNPLQNTVLQAAIGIAVGAIGIAACAGGFYLYLKGRRDKGGDDETERDLPPTREPLIDLNPKDNIRSEVSAGDTVVGPESTVIELPEGIETPRTGERESIVVTHHGAAKDVDPSKLGVPSQDIYGAHHISSSSVDLSQGQGPSDNDFE